MLMRRAQRHMLHPQKGGNTGIYSPNADLQVLSFEGGSVLHRRATERPQSNEELSCIAGKGDTVWGVTAQATKSSCEPLSQENTSSRRSQCGPVPSALPATLTAHLKLQERQGPRDAKVSQLESRRYKNGGLGLCHAGGFGR